MQQSQVPTLYSAKAGADLAMTQSTHFFVSSTTSGSMSLRPTGISEVSHSDLGLCVTGKSQFTVRLLTFVLVCGKQHTLESETDRTTTYVHPHIAWGPAFRSYTGSSVVRHVHNLRGTPYDCLDLQTTEKFYKWVKKPDVSASRAMQCSNKTGNTRAWNICTCDWSVHQAYAFHTPLEPTRFHRMSKQLRIHNCSGGGPEHSSRRPQPPRTVSSICCAWSILWSVP